MIPALILKVAKLSRIDAPTKRFAGPIRRSNVIYPEVWACSIMCMLLLTQSFSKYISSKMLD